jgi:hypothetical protein
MREGKRILVLMTPFFDPASSTETSKGRPAVERPGSIRVVGGKLQGTLNKVSNWMTQAICQAIIFLLPIAMIAVGCLYFNDCRASQFIPIYLIIGGGSFLVTSLRNFLCYLANRRQYSDGGDEDDEGDEDGGNSVTAFNCSLYCFLVVWFIVGSIWVLAIYKPNTDDPTVRNYCHPVVYYMAFALTIASYVVCCLAIFVTCCLICIGLMSQLCGRDDPSNV